jgi:hypothetical protein
VSDDDPLAPALPGFVEDEPEPALAAGQLFTCLVCVALSFFAEPIAAATFEPYFFVRQARCCESSGTAPALEATIPVATTTVASSPTSRDLMVAPSESSKF